MNSVLNPDAPEFYPHLKSATKVGYSKVKKTIRSSQQWPVGASYDLFKTFTDFNIITCKISENVILQSNQILDTELPHVKFKRNDNEYNVEKVIDANDNMLDRVNINIDTECGLNRPDDKFKEGVQQAANVASWNKQKAPEIAKLQMGSTTFIGAKNIPRPQITFKDTIDNSDSLWVPKISDKPNNIHPLALTILYDENKAVGYEHPYQVELDLYQPPAEFINYDPAPPEFPPPLEETKFTYIDTEAQVDELVKHLMDVKELAIDVEHHSYRTYQGITCLIQISTNEGGDFIIDTLAVREHIHKLNIIFTDPKKLKVLHGAGMDVLWLQRDFGVYIVGLFDTHQAAEALKVNGLSLKSLLLKYCEVDADKKYQLADWRIRPLLEEMIVYARLDTHFLLYIWRRMKADLLEAAAGQPTLLLSVFEQSRQICGKTYNKEVVDESSHMQLYLCSRKSFNSQQMAALQLLYKWRDSQARELDESAGYLIPNHMLLSLAETLPREVQGVNACCSPMPPFVKQNLITLHRLILSCRELPTEPQLYQMPSSIRNMVNMAPHALAYNAHDLTQLPDFREENMNSDGASVFLDENTKFLPDIQAFATMYTCKNEFSIVSGLNVDAKFFIPPYDRYRTYRSLAQIEEIKAFKDTEAKIAALSQNNELIKSDVLDKLSQAKEQVEKEAAIVTEANDEKTQTVEKRKRKMSTDKLNRKETRTETKKNAEVNSRTHSNKSNNTIKSFVYTNANYRKFFDESNKTHKQPKKVHKKKK